MERALLSGRSDRLLGMLTNAPSSDPPNELDLMTLPNPAVAAPGGARALSL